MSNHEKQSEGGPQEKPCHWCGHKESDHDGYGGMCDGLGWNEFREVCGCVEYMPAVPRPKRNRRNPEQARTPPPASVSPTVLQAHILPDGDTQ